MSIESVKRQFEEMDLDLEILEFEQSSATVELAAQRLGVVPDKIAKTMAFKTKEREFLIVAAGGARIDNRKCKDYFNAKVKMLKLDEVIEVTGHPVGGVCPFGLKNPIQVYLDETLRKFDYVYPAGGSPNSAVKTSIEQLETITNGIWVDVCKE